MKNERQIAKEYQEFCTLAAELANKQCPPNLREDTTKYDDTYSEHLCNMLEMYHIKYGDPEERLRIVTFLESQLFRTPPITDEVCHLVYNMWQDLKNTIISGEYKVATPSKSDKEGK